MKKAKTLYLLAIFSVIAMILAPASVIVVEPSDASTDSKMQKDIEPRLMHPIKGVKSYDLAVP
ncbi:MAG: hypothetical protein FE048_03930, partial [Thermoplasmata archaeon]